MAARSDRIVGLVCEWSAKLDGHLGPDGQLQDVPGTRVIKVMCSGMVKPEWVELALKQGAAGCFVVGCPMGDCHFREGNKFIDDRLAGIRPPKLKTKGINPERIGVFFKAAEDTAELIEELKRFREKCLALEPTEEELAAQAKAAAPRPGAARPGPAAVQAGTGGARPARQA